MLHFMCAAMLANCCHPPDVVQESLEVVLLFVLFSLLWSLQYQPVRTHLSACVQDITRLSQHVSGAVTIHSRGQRQSCLALQC